MMIDSKRNLHCLQNLAALTSAAGTSTRWLLGLALLPLDLNQPPMLEIADDEEPPFDFPVSAEKEI
jgi:hypothetical protein